MFALRGNVLSPRFVLGENMRQLSTLRINVGEGLVGWVAENGNYILNGNPTVEPGLEGARRAITLRSALAVPVHYGDRILGVLAVYALQPDSFTAEHLSVLQATAEQLAPLIEQSTEAERSRRSSGPADWRHQSGHARRRATAEAQTGAYSVLTSAK